MTDSTCPDSTCRFRNRFGYCTVTTCVVAPMKVAIDPDLVKVVRCRDCVEWEAPTKAEQADGETFGHCRCRFGTCYGQKVDMNWFCADGERGE